MSRALAVRHGPFGRATLYLLDRDMAMHAHREGHLLFLVEGQPATVIVDGAPQPLSATEACAVDPWRPHSFVASDRMRGSLFLVLYLDQRWYRDMAAGGALRFGAPRVRRTPAIDGLVSRVATQLLAARPGDGVGRALFELAQTCLRQAEPAAAPPPAAAPDFRVRRAIRLMEQHLTDGAAPSLASVARRAGLSRSHFFQLFRDTLGMTPNLYLNMLRMETAIARLTAGEEAVTTIALDLGFSSQASFTRFFAANVGIPPSDYRRAAAQARAAA